MNASVKQTRIIKVGHVSTEKTDLLAVEEPLEIRILFGPIFQREERVVTVTMRTPGNDFELALGLLFNEHIIEDASQLSDIRYCEQAKAKTGKENVVKVILKESAKVDLSRLSRNFYTSSSCGVCGKNSIESIEIPCHTSERAQWMIEQDVILQAPEKLRKAQLIFRYTGGLHAAGLFDTSGELLLWREDVGRHNALDKLIGAALAKKQTPLNNHFIVLSGRVSFELVQKAAMAGLTMIVAVGAPSSLAVELAHQYQIALLGFVRNNSFNIYSGEDRIQLSYETIAYTQYQ